MLFACGDDDELLLVPLFWFRCLFRCLFLCLVLGHGVVTAVCLDFLWYLATLAILDLRGLASFGNWELEDIFLLDCTLLLVAVRVWYNR